MRDKIFILVIGLLLALLPAHALSQTDNDSFGYVSFITVPSGASVSVNDPIGTTPITDYQIPPGTYLYTILKDGYVPVQKSFSVTAGQHLTINNALQPISPTSAPTTIPTTSPSGRGSIYATTSPLGSSIYLNGIFQGYAPLLIPDLQPRMYTVLARLSGYSDYAQNIQVYGNAQSRFDVVLQPSPVHHDYGYISVSSNPSGASIYIDNNYRGVTPATITEYPGIHTVELELSGYYDASQQVSLAADSTQYVSVSLTPVTPALGGSILVVSSPPVASVYLDGTYRGQTGSQGNLVINSIPQGTYQARVTKPQYYDYLTTTYVNPGTQSLVQAVLSPVVTVTPTPAPGQTGSLSVSSIPPGAQVSIDGVFRGLTPGVFGDLSPGMHVVTITSPGYSDFQGSFEVLSGQTTPISVVLNAQPTPTTTAWFCNSHWGDRSFPGRNSVRFREEEHMSALTGLTTKYTALFLVLIVIVSGTGAYFTLDVAGNAVQAAVFDELKTSAGIMATQVNATGVESLIPGDEGSANYIAIAEQLVHMRSANDRITNAYIMRVNEDQVITFVVDDFYLEDPGETPRIGEVYRSPDQQDIFMALSVPTSSNGVYTDKFGTFVSGYAPIRDSNGNTIAVLGIDAEASGLIGKSNAIRNTYIALLGVLVIVSTLVVFIISFTLARDIRLITRRVEEIRTGTRTVEADIHRRDELGELSRAIDRLEEHLK